MGSMGESGSSINATDTGVATYVGGDMLIGKRTDDATMRNNNGDTGGPDGSYAAEIEGAAIVNGNLYAKPKKGFFTAGIVAFGSQFVPAAGTRILTVAGNSDRAMPDGGHHAYAWHDPAAPGLSDMSRSVVGIADNRTIDGKSSDYTAAIAGGLSTVYGKLNDSTYNAVVPYSGNSNHVTWNWNATDALNNIPGLTNVATNDSDFSGYGDYLKELSGQLSNVQTTGTVTEGTLNNEDVNSSGQPYRRYKYNWGNSKGEASYMYAFNGLDEKLLVFTGDGESSMQVFNLDASMLNDMGGKSGVSFEFKDIPADASVVINVTGGNVEFNNGWRFIWNYESDKQGVDLGYTDEQEAQGRVDLSNGYWNGAGAVNGDSGKQQVAYGDYSTRASRIIWNFADATDVTINGGQAVGGWGQAQNIQGGGNHWGQGGSLYKVDSTDDPAAAFMGSILVPDGSFESHVTTNGRVWVNGDYSMYNPDASHSPGNSGDAFINNAGQLSSSVIDMDQERHNLLWSGNYVTGCAVIQWSKTDENGNLLSGTTWGIYASEDTSAKPLTTVSDNGAGDLDAAGGSLRVGGLNPNATYYIRETKAPDGYSLNTKVYTVTVGEETGEEHATPVTGDYGGAIRNTPSSVSWTKTDKDDPGHHPGGSEWTLSLTGDDGSTLSSWTVTDIGDKAMQCTPDGTRLCDANHEPGSITVNKLPDGSYTLVETKAPDGYVESTATYPFTITDGKAEWADSASADGASIPNERRTGSIVWAKTSSATADRLSGSEWTLTKTKDFAWGADGKTTYTDITNPRALTITDCTDASCAAGTGTHDADTNAGGFRIEGLAWGVYELVESKAPDGYDLDSTVRVITIGPGGVTAAIGSESTGSQAGGDAFFWNLGGIENSPGATLPDTGGPGRDAMLPAGVALTLIALLGLAARTARRRA